ncbi:MAG TPA: amidohydrolase family protein [Gemmatimonadales bacterium]|nr:amidohydrolase family protein [Gemmatimonadales bacterium]
MPLHLVLACLAATIPEPTHPPCDRTEAVTAFVDVTVIPMDRERTIPGQTVLVRGDRIVEVGPVARVKVPDGGTRVDGRGRFLMPGLAEMHAHIPGGQVADDVVERTLFLYVAGGITTIRGMLGHPRHLELRARAARGELVSPTIYTSGPSLNGTSIPSAEAAARAVAEQKAAGYDLLKIHPGVGREAFDTLAAAARRAGMPFAGHVPEDVGIARALEARYSTIDHLDGYIEGMLREGATVTAEQSAFFGLNLGEQLDQAKLAPLVAETRRTGVWNVPTQVLLENLIIGGSTQDLMQRPEMRYVPRQTRAQWAEVKDGMLSETGSTPESARRTIEMRRRLIRALHAAGAGLLLGSDAPQIFNVPGFSTHRELESLVASGLTPYQALETGTRNVALFFGTLKATGTIERGKRADLILLDANPLADIRNTTKRSGVMVRGRWLPQAEIERRLAEVEKAAS